jgi:hypothetical protein
MSPLFANLELTDFLVIAVICFLSGTASSLSGSRQRVNLRRVERKLDALLKHHGIELPSGISPDVQQLARDPSHKIEAIKLHREDHPGLGLAEAKAQIEEFIRSGR